MKSLGLRLDFIDENEEVVEYDDSELKMHNLNGKDYFCTDFQFLMIKREKEIEEDLLARYGVIDYDELNDLVMQELMSRHFLIGPDKSEIPNMDALTIPDTVID